MSLKDQWQEQRLSRQQMCQTLHVDTQAFLSSRADRRRKTAEDQRRKAEEQARFLNEYARSLREQIAEFLTQTETERSLMAKRQAQNLAEFHNNLRAAVWGNGGMENNSSTPQSPDNAPPQSPSNGRPQSNQRKSKARS